MALQALGKLYNSLARRKAAWWRRPSPKRWSTIRPRCWSIRKNYMAANDLGVLLAENGNITAARTMLEHSLALSRASTTCQNLAVVYRQLGTGRAGQPRPPAGRDAPAGRTRLAKEVVGNHQRRRAMGGSANVRRNIRQHAEFPRCHPAPPAQRSGRRSSRTALPPAGNVFGNSESTETVAPMGVATPAGPRHADEQSTRVASSTPAERHLILLCQALGPAAPYDICGIDCFEDNCCRRGWEAARAIQWQAYAQGEYVGHARLAHVPEYRLRVDDSARHDLSPDARRNADALSAQRGRRDPGGIVHRPRDQPQPAHSARRHHHAAAAWARSMPPAGRLRNSATPWTTCTRSTTRFPRSPSRR